MPAMIQQTTTHAISLSFSAIRLRINNVMIAMMGAGFILHQKLWRTGDFDEMRPPEVEYVRVSVDVIGRGHVELHGSFVTFEEHTFDVVHLEPGGDAGNFADADMVPVVGHGGNNS